MERITIEEECRIPGTDIVLEKGDVISVVKEAQSENRQIYIGNPS